MEQQRPHRSISTVEVGFADAGRTNASHHPAAHAAPPQWLVSYETRRPREVMELIAEFIGVFFYVSFGIAATLSFNITTIAKEAGYGSLLNIALAYGFGIAFGIIVAGPTSGSHLSPAFTIAFALFKGFPWRKVPQYIVAQILGAFCAALLVYAAYGEQARAVVAGLNASPLTAPINYSPAGIAGALAIFPSPNQSLGLIFLNELISTTLLGLAVFTCLDPTSLFVSFASVPWIIGMAFTGIILGFAVDTVTLNTARDLGGRFAAACIYGTAVFPSRFTALAALTNILGTLLGGAIQVFFLSDHRRAKLHHPPPTHTAGYNIPIAPAPGTTTDEHSPERRVSAEKAHVDHV
jgi:glycerol uptake facilitator-like aquaporin